MSTILDKPTFHEHKSMAMDNHIDLTALHAFRTVIRERSFTAAALVLRMPKSTLSKRVADLEADLGVRLIERSTRALRVTTEGAVLAARADRLLGDADDIRRTLRESGATPSGHLRIAIPTLMGHLMMGGLAARFRAAHPDITLEVLFLDRPPDLLEEGFHGALRFGPIDDGQQVSRAVMQVRAVLAAAPGLAGIGAIAHPRDLPGFPSVGLSTGWTGTWGQLIGPRDETFQLSSTPPLMLGSFLAVRDAIQAGAGLGLLPELLARPGFRSGALVPVLPDWATVPKTMHFIYPSAQSVTARLRAFIDFLLEDLRRGLNGHAPGAGL